MCIRDRFVVALVLGECSAQDLALRETYRDTKSVLRIHYPSEWNLDRKAISFVILSFDPARRPPQLLVPMNEAQIVLASAPQGTDTIDDWMKKERINPEQGYQITRVELATDRYGPTQAMLCQRKVDVIQGGSLTIYFLKLDAKVFKASLLFRGDARADYFKAVLLAVIKNLEPDR